MSTVLGPHAHPLMAKAYYAWSDDVKTHYRGDGETCEMFFDVFFGNLDGVKKHVTNPDFAYGRFVAEKSGILRHKNANHKAFKPGMTMLRMACEGLQVEVVRFLLRNSMHVGVNERFGSDMASAVDGLFESCRSRNDRTAKIIQILDVLAEACAPGEACLDMDKDLARGVFCTHLGQEINSPDDPFLALHMIRLGARVYSTIVESKNVYDHRYMRRLNGVIRPRLCILSVLEAHHPSQGRRGRMSTNVIRRIFAALVDDSAWLEYLIPPPPPAMPALAGGGGVNHHQWYSSDEDEWDDGEGNGDQEAEANDDDAMFI